MKRKSYVIVLALSLITINAKAQPGTIDPTFNVNDLGYEKGYGPDGYVYNSLLQSDGKILIIGEFAKYNGKESKYIVRLNPDGSADESFNIELGPSFYVYASAVQQDGKIIIGGSFTAFNKIPQGNICRLNKDGSLDSTFAIGYGTNGTVHAISVRPDGKILVGGSFNKFNDAASGRLVRLNQDGSTDTSFAKSKGPNNAILSLKIQPDGRILVGGAFTSYNDTTYGRLVRLKPNGTLDTTFHSGTGADADINVIELQEDGKILIGGKFAKYNNILNKSIVRLKNDGSIDNMFNTGTGASGIVYSIKKIPYGNILVGGAFSRFNDIVKEHLVCLDQNGSIDENFDALEGPDGTVRNINLTPHNKIILAGEFETYNGSTSNFIACLYSNGTYDGTFNIGSGANAKIWSITCQFYGKYILNGDFTKYNGEDHFRICRINTNGSVDPSFKPGKGANNTIFKTIVQSNGKLYIIGKFTTYNGISRCGIARLGVDGTLDGSFNAGFDSYTRVLDAFVQTDGKIVVSVNHHVPMVESRFFLCRLNPDGSRDNTFITGSGADNYISMVLKQPDGKIIIKGGFSTYNGTVRDGIARLSDNGTIDSGYNPGKYISGDINTLAIQSDGKLVILGSLKAFNGIKISNIARLNVNGTIDTTFVPGAGPSDFLNPVIAFQPDDYILITGARHYSGVPQYSITRLEPNGQLDRTFKPGTGVSKYGAIMTVFVQNDGKILVGGDFFSFNNVGRNNIARLMGGTYSSPEPPYGHVDNGFNPIDSGYDVSNYPSYRVNKILIQPDSKIICANSMHINSYSVPGMMRLNTDGNIDYSFLKGPGPNGNISDMALQSDGKIVVTGNFSAYNTIPLKYIARLNSDGSLDSTFHSSTGANKLIHAICIQSDGKVVIGGEFTTYNALRNYYLARLNADGSLDQTFKPEGISGTVFALTGQPDGKVLITTKNGLIRINSDGTLDETFNVSINGTASQALIQTISLQNDGKIIIGGHFINVNGKYRRRIARLNPDGSLDEVFNAKGTGTSSCVYTTSIQSDGKIIVGGEFNQYNSYYTNGIMRLNIDGTIDSAFAQHTESVFRYNYYTSAIQPNGEIIAGGELISSSHLSKPIIARFSVNGDFDYAFHFLTGCNAEIKDFAVQKDGKILIGGFFDTYNGVKRNFLARLNSNGLLDETFDAKIRLKGGGVFSIAVQDDNKIIIAGEFSNINGMTRPGIARLNQDGSLDASFTPAFNGIARVLAIQPDGRIVVGRAIPNIINVLRLNVNGSIDTTFLPVQMNGSIYDLAIQSDGKIIAGGNYSKCNDVFSCGITRLNPDGSLDNSFISPAHTGIIYSIAVQPDNKVIAGGSFGSIGHQNIKNLVRLNCDGTIDNSFRTKGTNEPVYVTLVKPNGKIIIGGNFTFLDNNIERRHIAFLTSDGQPDDKYSVHAGADRMVSAAYVQPDGKVLIGGQFTSFNGVGKNRVIRINGESIFYSINVTADPRYCTEKSYSIVYKSEGDYYQGNSFIAQLSDRTGNFDLPTVIGLKESLESDSLIVTIPGTTSLGTGYRIRIVSTNPSIFGSDNGSDITINMSPNKPDIYGVTRVCQGQPINLNTNWLEGKSYHWLLPDETIKKSLNVYIEKAQLTDSGNYVLNITDTLTGCSSITSIVNIDVLNTPELPEINTLSAVCENEKLTLNTPDKSNVVFLWSGPNGFISNDQNPVINDVTAEYSGIFKLNLMEISTGCYSDTTKTNIIVSTLPETPSIITYSPICIGDNLSISTPYIENVTYEWTGPNNTGSTERNFIIENVSAEMEGLYKLVITDNSTGCKSLPSFATINVELCTNIDGFETEGTLFDIYPNPVKDILHLRISKPGVLSIFSASSGRMVHKQKYTSATHIINVEYLENGLYYIYLQTETAQAGYKVMIMK